MVDGEVAHDDAAAERILELEPAAVRAAVLTRGHELVQQERIAAAHVRAGRDERRVGGRQSPAHERLGVVGSEIAQLEVTDAVEGEQPLAAVRRKLAAPPDDEHPN